MQVLFLGGPWHGERHEVPPCRRTRGLEGLPTLYRVTDTSVAATTPAPAPSPGDPGGDPVIYKRRFAQGGGQRRAVYVAPDYHGPARA